MKHRYFKWVLACVAFFISADTVYAQRLTPLQPEQDACNALQLCGNSFSTPYSYTGYGAIQEAQVNYLGGYGCCGENNSVWFKLVVTTPGTIAFTIKPVNRTDDYDFIVWDITHSSCSQLSSANLIRCNGVDNGHSQPWGYTGLNTTSTTTLEGPGFGDPFVSAITANAGDVFLIMIDNYSNSASGFTIDFTGTTAGFAAPAVAPAFDAVASTCGMSQRLKIKMNIPVQCSSIAADGSEFYVTPSGTVLSAGGVNCVGANGNTDTVFVNFTTPLSPSNYTLHARAGTGGITVSDLCGNPMRLPDDIPFTVSQDMPPQIIRIDTPACIKAHVTFSHPVLCSSILYDGSNFAVSGPDTIHVIKAISYNCNGNGLTDAVDIVFNRSIEFPGVYTLTTIPGTDGSTIEDTCGLTMTNAFSWTVSDRGYVTATATPNVLCSPAFVTLDATTTTAPPPTVSGCGANGTIATTTPQLYQVGTATTPSTNATPFQYDNSRTRILYKKSDLIAAGFQKGTITKLALSIASKTSTLSLKQLTIKLACTTDTVLTSTSFQAYNTEVIYNAKDYNTVLGFNVFTLDNTFDWDSTSLLVEICYGTDLQSNQLTFTDAVQQTPQPYTCVLYMHALGSSNGCSIGSGYFSGDRPNMYFTLAPAAAPVYTYKWAPDNFLDNGSVASTNAYVSATTTYTVEIKDKDFCYRRDTAVVNVSDRHFSIAPADTTICLGDQIGLQATGGTYYQWSSSTALSCDNCPDPMVLPTEDMHYQVIVADQYHCADTLAVHVGVKTSPQVIASPHDTTVDYGSTIQLTASGADGYIWQSGSLLDDPIIANPVATVTASIIFIVTGKNENGCNSTDSVKVNVDNRGHLFIPSAFTPNGDGKNDVFKIANVKFQQVIEFRVFNRWGQEVFNTTDGAKGWDGTWKGIPQEMGTYQYIIRIGYPDGYMETNKGDVTLIR